MSLSRLKSTTTLAIALSLLQPGIAFAQNADIVECAPGALGVSVPCLDPLTNELLIPAPRVAGDEAAYAAGAEAEVELAIALLEMAKTVAVSASLDMSLAAAVAADAKPEDAAEAVAALSTAETASEAADQAVADAEATVEAAETNAEIAALEASEAAALAAGMEAAEVAAAEAETVALAEALKAAEVAAAEAEAEAEAATALEATEAAAVEAEAAALAETAAVEAEADTAAEVAAELAAELEVAEASALAAELDLAEAAAAEAEAGADTDTDAAALAAALACDLLAPGTVCDSPDGDSNATQDNTPDVPTVAPDSEAAAAADTAPDEADLVIQTLTEEDTRSSTEEFGNAVGANANDGGLSNLEKAGLLVLGAVVVGAIINNNEKVVANSGDRVVTQDEDGGYRVYKDDNTLLMRPGATVRSEAFSDGSTRSFVLREDGTEIVTIRDADGRVLRRVHVGADGLETMLFDDTRTVEIVNLRNLPRRAVSDFDYAEAADRDALRLALYTSARQPADRNFSLRQIREIREVRDLAAEITLSVINFETASAAIRPAQAERLQHLGFLMSELIEQDPRELFLIEGHTDAVGDAPSNLALSDRRAETVALALAEYFDVPPENMVVQGYGERFLKISTQDAELRNRRVGVRRITELLH